MALSADAVRSQAGPVSRGPERPPAAPRAAPSPGADGTARSLASLVAGEIIPRLVLAHGDMVPAGQHPAPAGDQIEVETFAPLTFRKDTPALLAEVDRLIDAGVGVDAVMLDLLAPAARLLGRWWEEDRCGFIEVTMGLWRLQELVRELSRRFPPASPVPGRPGRDALFAPFPGEQHDFGAVMVSEMFGRHGWSSEVLVGAEMSDLLAATADRHYDVIGLTVSCDCHSGRLRSVIRSIRSVSRNAHVKVIVGGRVLNEQPSLAAAAVADGTAGDARGALLLAERLVGALTRDAVVRC